MKVIKKVVDGLGWCDFTVYDNGKIKVKSPFWEHTFFKPTTNIKGGHLKNPGFWLNKSSILHSPGVPLTKALNSV